MATKPPFSYNPQELPRELTPYYISASDQELDQMLEAIGKKDLADIFQHIPPEVFFHKEPALGPALAYEELANHLFEISEKNQVRTSFLGDGLKDYQVPEVVAPICNIRNLTTAYTPYQPERSQGTLNTLWIYSSCLSMLTGFEAVNASLYDRSTCLVEAINCASAIKRNKKTILLAATLHPSDLEVVNTLTFATKVNCIVVPTLPESGCLDLDKLVELMKKHQDDLAAVVFPQMNQYGNLENVNLLTDLSHDHQALAIGVIDPMLLAKDGLIPPASWGEKGADVFIGEGQHLCLAPNFGGPGLGIFGIRYNEHNKTYIRSTPGRYIGKATDLEGREAKVIVLSTREQHIRREKATSNICSNQSFVATIAGAAMLNRGEQGMSESIKQAHKHAHHLALELTQLQGVELAFPYSPFYNEFVLKLTQPVKDLIEKGRKQNLHIGIDMSERISADGNFLMISCFDRHQQSDLDNLLSFFRQEFSGETKTSTIPQIPQEWIRQDSCGLPQYTSDELIEYYQKLGDQNVSPDDNIYPLGSCTMKYNPYINDWAAGLEGFTQMHPQAPIEDAQGCLEVLYHIQEMFKHITGLPGVTTQPVAGAQGEMVGIKMFQAYHHDRGELEQRNIILIPRSAHGTNPATATHAGFESKMIDGKKYGIILVEANQNGEMDFDQLTTLIKEYSTRIAGIMVTNPNTAGLFETRFHEMAKLIHDVGGLVYMDGANMNAIAGWLDLNKLGVDAVHNNLHKTWTIPHGGGGPGDAIVAVSDRLIDYLPGVQIKKSEQGYSAFKTPKSIGSIHRHYGNFAHKVRAYTYLKALGTEGVKKMSAVAVLCAQYLYERLKTNYPTLPKGAEDCNRMHEFILTFSDDDFAKMQSVGIPKAQAIAKVGKLYLDFGIHAPTVAFPEPFGLMIEPTESYTKDELDRFSDVVKAIHHLIQDHPQVLNSAPHFTPIYKVDEVQANKQLVLSESLQKLPQIYPNRIDPKELAGMGVSQICEKILEEAKA